MLKHPWPDLWRVLRDELPRLTDRLDEVASIECLDRKEEPSGHVHIVNRWTAAPQLPAMLQSYVKPEMLTWIDEAMWDEAGAMCRWSIRFPYFQEHVRCAGETLFQPAMGGKGTRLSFSGALVLDGIPMGLEVLQGVLARGAESVVTRIVASNFQKLAKAAAEHIEAGS